VPAGPLSAVDLASALGRADAAAGLRRLSAASLVVADTAAEPARYGLLQTVRDYARRRLEATGHLDEVSAGHVRWLVDEVATATRSLCGTDELAGRRRLDALVPELRAAAAWCAVHDQEAADLLLGPLYPYARHGLLDEPFRWALAALGDAPDGARRPPGLVAMAAGAVLGDGDLRGALALADEAASGDDRRARIAAHDLRADALLFLGELDDAADAYRALEEEAELDGDHLHAGLGRLGPVLTLTYARRRADALDLARRLVRDPSPNASVRAWAEYGVGEAILDDDPPAAIAHFDRAVAIGRAVQSRYVVSMATVSAMSLQARHGELDAAVERFAEVIARLDRIGDRPHLLTVLRNLLVLLRRLGADEEVAWLAGVVDDPRHPSFGDEAELVRAVCDATSMARRDAGRWALGALARAGR
jgi:tetratricopeptide (TPR) repeat protein